MGCQSFTLIIGCTTFKKLEFRDESTGALKWDVWMLFAKRRIQTALHNGISIYVLVLTIPVIADLQQEGSYQLGKELLLRCAKRIKTVGSKDWVRNKWIGSKING